MRMLLFALVLLAQPSLVLAQESTSMPDTITPQRGDVVLPSGASENLGTKEVREGMVKFARCVTRRHEREASSFVIQDNQETWFALEKKIDDDCVLEAVKNPSGEVRVSTNSQDMLFALAEVLVQKKLGNYDSNLIVLAAPLESGRPSFGECTVRANPSGARDLMKTRINSKEEIAAIQAMLPAFNSCTEQGVTLRPDLTRLRGVVAVNYYRLANAPKAQAINKMERGQ